MLNVVKGAAESCVGGVIKARETMCWENGVFVIRGGGIGCHKAGGNRNWNYKLLCTIGGEWET